MIKKTFLEQLELAIMETPVGGSKSFEVINGDLIEISKPAIKNKP